ncbi:MAG: NUDIX domain-containing protein [Nitrososphaerales archaeon]
MTCVAEKVTAFVVRETAAGRQVLLFRHPSAGIQIPAGTVEAGEAPVAAALREGQEETGLLNLAVVRLLGIHQVELDGDLAVIGAACTVYSRPDPASWDWARLPRGATVYIVRRKGDWVQVDFQENNRFPDPEYLTFRVIGWVRAEILCTTLRRHFYLLTPTAPAPDAEWAVEIDYHIFRPFWAPEDKVLQSGGDVVESQRQWLEYLRGPFDGVARVDAR